MKRCGVCRKWYFGERRYCPNCQADLWYQEANERIKDCAGLMEYAGKLFQDGKEEKAAVMAQSAMEEMLKPEREIPLRQLESAVKTLEELYSGEKGLIPDELMEDALDYLEERAEACGDEACKKSLEEMRRQIGGWIPEARNVEPEDMGLPFLRKFWKLPSPETVIHASEGDFDADLTKTKGLSLTEICYFFFRRAKQAMPIVKELSERSAAIQQEDEADEELFQIADRLLSVIFLEVLMKRESAGPAVDVFWRLMSRFSPDGQCALMALYGDDFSEKTIETVRAACEKAAQEVGLFPETLFFNALLCPMLCRDEKEVEAIYDAMEPGMRNLLGIIEESQKKCRELQDEDEKQYRRQLIQTLCTEYSNIIAVGEYQRADAFLARGGVYRSLLESAAANGLSIACSRSARNWFYGENGYEVNLGYAKYYAVILRLRGLSYPIADAVEQVKDIQVEVPGMTP